MSVTQLLCFGVVVGRGGGEGKRDIKYWQQVFAQVWRKVMHTLCSHPGLGKPQGLAEKYKQHIKFSVLLSAVLSTDIKISSTIEPMCWEGKNNNFHLMYIIHLICSCSSLTQEKWLKFYVRIFVVATVTNDWYLRGGINIKRKKEKETVSYCLSVVMLL